MRKLLMVLLAVVGYPNSGIHRIVKEQAHPQGSGTMRALLAVLAVIGLGACRDLAVPVERTDALAAMLAAPSPAGGTWRYAGDSTVFAAIEFSLTRTLVHDTLYVVGDAIGDLRCAAGATAYVFATSAHPVPCRVTGRVYGQQISPTQIELLWVFREAPLAALGVATITSESTMTADTEVRHNAGRFARTALSFTRRP